MDKHIRRSRPTIWIGRLLTSLENRSETSAADEATLKRIRAQQLTAVQRLLPAMMVANIVCAAGLTAAMYNDYGHILLFWFGVTAALSLFRIYEFVIASRRPKLIVAERSRIWRMAIHSVTSALVYVSVPIWLLTKTSGLDYTIVVCQLIGTVWAGSLILATVAPAAIAFIAIVGVMICAGLLLVTRDAPHLFLVLLFLTRAATAIRSVREQSFLFVANHRQQLDLKRQGDLIGLLLKDYEEQTSDWLWETDALFRLKNPSPRFLQVLIRPLETVENAELDEILTSPEVAGNAAALALLRENFAAHRSFRDHVIPWATSKGHQWWSLSGRPFVDDRGTILGYRGVATDVTATKVAEARIAYMAHYDALTDLPNRTFFCARLDTILRTQPCERLAVLGLDLDGFKPVNDRFGHQAGDALLIEVTRRLRATVRSVDIVARFGGDEFTILVGGVSHADELGVLCRRLIQRLGTPFEVSGEFITIGVSIGVAFAPADGRSTEELLKNADFALYRAKADGRGTFRFFEPEMDKRAHDRQQLILDLRASHLQGELTLEYQPFVSTATGLVTGYEALVRWRHPVRGLVMPAEFIPLAEESGLVGPIGTWVIERACCEAAGWPAHQRVAINISAIQFRDPALPMIIAAALHRSGLGPGRLEIELTETVLIEDDGRALDILKSIREMGVQIALDDFGTGYSSLSYLRLFSFDRIKIDRSFVRQLESQHDSQVIVQGIIGIAQGLGMAITAEGVETLAQAKQLGSIGCSELQGYYFGRPAPAHNIRTDDVSGFEDYRGRRALLQVYG